MDRQTRLSLESLDDEIRIACKASGIDYKDAPEEFYNFFRHVQILIQDERLPDVTLNELGTFKSTPTSIKSALRYYKQQYKLGNFSRDFVKYVAAKLWYPYKRIVDYKSGSGGVISDKVGVGYFWTYVPMKFSHTLFPELTKKALEELENKKKNGETRSW